MNLDYTKDPDGSNALINTPPDEMFPAAYNFYKPAIFVQHKAYEISINPEIIIEENKLCGNEEEYLTEHLAHSFNLTIITLFGDD